MKKVLCKTERYEVETDVDRFGNPLVNTAGERITVTVSRIRLVVPVE